MVDLRHLAMMQIRSWHGTHLDHVDTRARLKARIESRDNANVNTFVYELNGGEVTIRPAEHIRLLQAAGHQLEVVRRAMIFARLLRDALALRPLEYPLTVAIDMGDLAQPADDLPIFSFQKDVGSRVIVLPDHEIVELDYLDNVVADNLPFEAKKDAAFFSGSTTGVANYTLEDLAAQRVPRVRAARFFQNHDNVDFFLPNVCQYASEDARAMLVLEGFGDGIPIGLSEAYKYKFSILMDGNGATCSRTAILLHSHSALMKYESSYELYYTPALVPGEHFIPILDDADVIDIIEQERQNPGAFAAIAANGKNFAGTILSRESILLYTRYLLDEYANLFYQ